MKSNDTIKQILRIGACVVALTIVMLIIFALTGFFSSRAVLGALIGAVVSVANFALLALTLEYSLGKGARRAQGIMGISYTLRIIMIGAAIVFAIKSPHINYVAAAIPLVFPRIGIMLLNLITKNGRGETSDERTEDTV